MRAEICLAPIGGFSKESLRNEEGISGGDTKCSVEFLGQQECFYEPKWNTALHPLSPRRNGLRTDSEKKIIERFGIHL